MPIATKGSHARGARCAAPRFAVQCLEIGTFVSFSGDWTFGEQRRMTESAPKADIARIPGIARSSWPQAEGYRAAAVAWAWLQICEYGRRCTRVRTIVGADRRHLRSASDRCADPNCLSSRGVASAIERLPAQASHPAEAIQRPPSRRCRPDTTQHSYNPAPTLAWRRSTTSSSHEGNKKPAILRRRSA